MFYEVIGFSPNHITSLRNHHVAILNAQSHDMNSEILLTFKESTAKIFRTFATATITCTIFISSLTPSYAADYGSLTTEQKAVIEAWRIVDNNFFDRTFNNQDWFKIRQDALKKKYKSMDEANREIEKIVGSLGDKYTRYLPPAKYKSIVDSATGTLAGVGVEISVNKDTNKVYVADVEPSSPAFEGKFILFQISFMIAS